MLAANLGVVCSFSVDDVEDLRMAAEEGFVYACATKPESCAVTFDFSDGTVEITYSLGDADASEDETIAYADLLLAALCDDYEIDADKHELYLMKHVGTVENADR
ncbi:MAG: ATP-binding protein [Olsenella sp.]|nr:ATP-binding protein [Olsenella sp.]